MQGLDLGTLEKGKAGIGAQPLPLLVKVTDFSFFKKTPGNAYVVPGTLHMNKLSKKLPFSDFILIGIY